MICSVCGKRPPLGSLARQMEHRWTGSTWSAGVARVKFETLASRTPYNIISRDTVDSACQQIIIMNVDTCAV